MSNSLYFSQNPFKSTNKAHGPRNFIAFLLLSMIFVSLLGVIAPQIGDNKKAEAFDPIQWLACSFPTSRDIYQIVQTSDVQFKLFSKSYVGAGAEDVREGWNGILDYVRTNGGKHPKVSFENINQTITGQDFAGTIPEDGKEYKRWNKGPVVNPYDRFGVAGLKFSNYMGEWKHFFIDACAGEEAPDAKFDTGTSSNLITVATWNICANRNLCDLPTVKGKTAINPDTGSVFTPKDIWKDFDDRMARGAAREMKEIRPDVLLAQGVVSGGGATPGGFYDSICAGMGHMSDSVAKHGDKICFSTKKFRQIKNAEYPKAQGGYNFASKGIGSAGGFVWSILEDKSYRRSVFVSLDLKGGSSDSTRKAQTAYMMKKLDSVFKGSGYPIIIGGDFNSKEGIKSGAAPQKIMRNNGYDNIFERATSPRDLNKNTFQGFSPWRSSGCNSDYCNGTHLDHIWFNNFVGVGEARVYAPAGPASSDHAMVSATMNVNGTYVPQAGDPKDPQTNKYYDTRLEPKSTWEDIGTSKDVRTLQFSKGWVNRYIQATSTNVVNTLFGITKFVVIFTIALIGIAFSDIPALLKLNEIIAGHAGNDGLFNALYDNIFTPLIFLAMLGTAVHIFWFGIIKRQFRQALGDFLKSIACFMAAVIIAVKPLLFISLPNNTAIVAQAIVAQAMNTGLVGTNDLCKTEAADLLKGSSNTDPTDVKQASGILAQASLNMQSAVGCSLWLNLLVRPWTEGQFGSEYRDLYGPVDGECTAPTDGRCMGYDKKGGINRNWSWTVPNGPLVPLGGKKSEFNWALLQISTQTNAHSPILPPEKRGVASKYSQGVAHDWWRIVDAVSNYDVEITTDFVCDDGFCGSTANGGTAPKGSTKTAPSAKILPTDVLKEWDAWVGNNQTHRYSVVFGSILVAIVGVMAPLFFAGLAVLYAVGLSILMAFAPIFLLFGCWAGRGWNLFKAWADLVINTTMKRIAVGILTILSISFVSTILQSVNQPGMGYWKSMLLMIVISAALIKSRDKIFQAVSFARFSTADLGSTASKVSNTVKTAGSAIGGAATATAAGGATGVARGDGFKGGALAGFKSYGRDLSYRNKTLRIAMNAADMTDDRGSLSKYVGQNCIIDGDPILPGDRLVWVDYPGGEGGGPIQGAAHLDCAYKYTNKEIENHITDLGIVQDRSERQVNTAFNPDAKEINKVIASVNENSEENLDSLKTLIQASNKEISDYITLQERNKDRKKRDRDTAPPPPIPVEIAPYVNQRTVDMAWEMGEYEYVRLAYASGWKNWAETDRDVSFTEDEKAILLATTQHLT